MDNRMELYKAVDEYFDEAPQRDPYDLDSAITDYRSDLVDKIVLANKQWLKAYLIAKLRKIHKRKVNRSMSCSNSITADSWDTGMQKLIREMAKDLELEIPNDRIYVKDAL